MAERCPKLTCSSLQSNTCYTPSLTNNTVTEVKMSACPWGQICSSKTGTWDFGKTPLTCSPVASNSRDSTTGQGRLETDTCSSASQCSSGTCTEGRCVGKALGSVCEKSSECVWNGFCNTEKKCEQRRANDGACTKDDHCVNTAGCNTDTQKCVTYYSIKVGEKSQDAQSCESGYRDPDTKVCEHYSATTAKCNLDVESEKFCEGITSITKKKYTGMRCNCNPDGSATGICEPNSDSDLQKTVRKTQLAVVDNKCHRDHMCWNVPTAQIADANKAAIASMGASNYDCLVQASSGFISFSVVVMAIIAFIF